MAREPETAAPATGRPLRFAGVGAVGFAVDAGILAGGLSVGLPAWAARVPSFVLAVGATWALNRRLTFRTGAVPTLREFGAYLAAMSVGLGVNYATYLAGLFAGLSPLIALCVASGVALVVNFLAARRVLDRP